MKVLCNLDGQVNKCPFYDQDTSLCNNEKQCSFQEKIIIEKNTNYIRKER